MSLTTTWIIPIYIKGRERRCSHPIAYRSEKTDPLHYWGGNNTESIGYYVDSIGSTPISHIISSDEPISTKAEYTMKLCEYSAMLDRYSRGNQKRWRVKKMTSKQIANSKSYNRYDILKSILGIK